MDFKTMTTDQLKKLLDLHLADQYKVYVQLNMTTEIDHVMTKRITQKGEAVPGRQSQHPFVYNLLYINVLNSLNNSRAPHSMTFGR